MASEKRTREYIINEAKNMIGTLNEIIDTAQDSECDLVDLGFIIDKLDRHTSLKDILGDCDEY